MTNVIEGFFQYSLMRRMGTFGSPMKPPSFAGAEIIKIDDFLPPVSSGHSTEELTQAVLLLGGADMRDPGVAARQERIRREIEALDQGMTGM